MKNLWALLCSLTIALLACSSSSHPTPPQVTCGSGTHDNGTGSCVIDNALTVLNRVGSNYWNCSDGSSRFGPFYDLSFGSSSSTGGSGTLWQEGRFVNSTGNAYQHYTFTWLEGPGTSAISVSSNPYFDTLINIAPTSPTATQSFSATGVKSGVDVFVWSCGLTLGSF